MPNADLTRIERERFFPRIKAGEPGAVSDWWAWRRANGLSAPDIEAMERELVARLESGGGVVPAEFWQPFVRPVLEDDATVERLKAAARTWRRERGMTGERFIVGTSM